MRAARSTTPGISRSTPRLGAIAAFGWRSITIASAATSVVIGHIAAGTNTIRVGAGGIMLPNHAPYVIAEQFGTLANAEKSGIIRISHIVASVLLKSTQAEEQ
jgi:hypothetical protein